MDKGEEKQPPLSRGKNTKAREKNARADGKNVLARRFAYFTPPQIFKQEGFIFWGAVGYSVRSHTAIFAGPRFCQSAYGMAVKGTCLRRRSWVK